MTLFLQFASLLIGFAALTFMLVILGFDKFPRLKIVVVACIVSFLGTIGTIGGLCFNIFAEPSGPSSQPDFIVLAVLGSILFYFVAGYFSILEKRRYLHKRKG